MVMRLENVENNLRDKIDSCQSINPWGGDADVKFQVAESVAMIGIFNIGGGRRKQNSDSDAGVGSRKSLGLPILRAGL